MHNKLLHDCPCGSGQTFQECCGKYINYTHYPETPELLMRSRYSAYVIKDEEYLLKSWYESTRPKSLDLENDTTQWGKLKIISASGNMVHFVAFFSNNINGKESYYFLSEKSEFIKNGHWFYLEGKEIRTTELSKNMLCPCQSGKKFKRCCATEL